MPEFFADFRARITVEKRRRIFIDLFIDFPRYMIVIGLLFHV